jgi:hypothetical protein
MSDLNQIAAEIAKLNEIDGWKDVALPVITMVTATFTSFKVISLQKSLEDTERLRMNVGSIMNLAQSIRSQLLNIKNILDDSEVSSDPLKQLVAISKLDMKFRDFTFDANLGVDLGFTKLVDDRYANICNIAAFSEYVNRYAQLIDTIYRVVNSLQQVIVFDPESIDEHGFGDVNFDLEKVDKFQLTQLLIESYVIYQLLDDSFLYFNLFISTFPAYVKSGVCQSGGRLRKKTVSAYTSVNPKQYSREYDYQRFEFYTGISSFTLKYKYKATYTLPLTPKDEEIISNILNAKNHFDDLAINNGMKIGVAAHFYLIEYFVVFLISAPLLYAAILYLKSIQLHP